MWNAEKRNDFYNMLEVGKAGEDIIAEMFNEYGFETVRNNDYKYDLLIPDLNITIEIKSDEAALKYGNYAVEYQCHGKPSGIETTRADYWCFHNSNSNVFIATENIVMLIADNNYEMKHMKGMHGLDDNWSYIIPCVDILYYSIKPEDIIS